MKNVVPNNWWNENKVVTWLSFIVSLGRIKYLWHRNMAGYMPPWKADLHLEQSRTDLVLSAVGAWLNIPPRVIIPWVSSTRIEKGKTGVETEKNASEEIKQNATSESEIGSESENTKNQEKMYKSHKVLQCRGRGSVARSCWRAERQWAWRLCRSIVVWRG